MLAHPDYWGSAEAYELQVLLLLEMELMVLGEVSDRESLQRLQERYAIFLSASHPDIGARPLSAITSETREIGKALREFRNAMVHGQRPPQVAYGSAETAKNLPRDVYVEKHSNVMPRML